MEILNFLHKTTYYLQYYYVYCGVSDFLSQIRPVLFDFSLLQAVPTAHMCAISLRFDGSGQRISTESKHGILWREKKELEEFFRHEFFSEPSSAFL